MPSLPTIPDPEECAARLRSLRARLGLTQVRLAELLGVSFATVNRWENSQSRPSPLAWRRILRAEQVGVDGLTESLSPSAPAGPAASEQPADHGVTPFLDFSACPNAVWAVAEAERLGWGHQASPAFGSEIALIDPLPHQRMAVYEVMLPQPRLRLLLADDAGAGKTIMVGLYIREMLSRRLLRRVLIVPPAGLVGNWRRELDRLFGLRAPIIQGSDARDDNPFLGPDSDLLIVSLDTLAGERMFARLQDGAVTPYDLVVFDEAHKLAADREPDFGLRKTDRYKLAEAIAGVAPLEERWQLGWRAKHLILLTATPHMGKDCPYYCLWRLLEPQVLSTAEAFSRYPESERRNRFIRRVKEEMVRYDGNPIYPSRVSDTLGYRLTTGEVSEQALYVRTTRYITTNYSRARALNRSAVRLAMSVFQRRLASSTYALLRSLERRLALLDEWIAGFKSGRLSPAEYAAGQRRLDQSRRLFEAIETRPADEESAEQGREQGELAQEEILRAAAPGTLDELELERLEVKELVGLAQAVYQAGDESKLNRLSDLLTAPAYRDQKLLIFTEHRDTLEFLVRRLEAMGHTGRVAQIHGGMPFDEREAQIGFFKKPGCDGGATYMVATDAAGEGLNMQFCWLMVNYDLPWNPARLEQRLGRIHRYGQQHDPVVIINLLAEETREGHVMKVLLDKLERIRREMRSDKVFDVVGRLFAGVSINEYMESAIVTEDCDRIAAQIEGLLTEGQVKAIEERERRLFGEGGDVRPHLPRLREALAHDTYRQLLPGYVRRFVERAASLVNLAVDGDLDGFFRLSPLKAGALDPLLTALESYPGNATERLTVRRVQDPSESIYLRPGECLFERFRHYVVETHRRDALRGAVFVDPSASHPYLFHLALVRIERRGDPELVPLARDETLEYRLVGLRHEESGHIEPVAVEHLLMLRGGTGIPASARAIASSAQEMIEQARSYASASFARALADAHSERLEGTVTERTALLSRGFDYQEAELLAVRTDLFEKARRGDQQAAAHLTRVKDAQRKLAAQRTEALVAVHREAALVEAGAIRFIAHALVVPSSDPGDLERHDKQTEAIAVSVARVYEEALGAMVRDVSTPRGAVAAGLDPYPGFDLLATRPDGSELAIEVKGRAGVGDVELKDNEWARACNLRDRYWLYAVYDCAAPRPRLFRVQDPFGALLVRTRGAVLIGHGEVIRVAQL